jgi:prephenate dehydrogenase
MPTTPLTIAILGLGRLGASLAMALMAPGRANVRVVGYDREPDVARLAQSRKLIGRAVWNLPAAVESSDLAVLAVPVGELAEAVRVALPALREGAVLAVLGSLLGPTLSAVAQHAAPGCHVVAVHPSLSPAFLHSGEAGLDAADGALFRGGLWALAAAPGCAPEALRLVADLARLVEARPYFSDPAEHDGLAAAVDGLPALLAWALQRAAEASPGWPEARKLADRSFATATAALVDADSGALAANRESLLRYLDAALAGLAEMRAWLGQGDALTVKQALAQAAERRAAWLAQRRAGNWEALEHTAVPLPTAGEHMGRLLLGGLAGRKDDPAE